MQTATAKVLYCASHRVYGEQSSHLATPIHDPLTLNEDGKIERLLNEMARLKIDILGVAETHWNVDTPETWESNGFIVFSSTRKDKLHKQGVAIIIKKEIAEHLTDYKIISERLISIEIDTNTGPYYDLPSLHIRYFLL